MVAALEQVLVMEHYVLLGSESPLTMSGLEGPHPS